MLLSVDELKVSYRCRPVLNGVSFSIAAGEVVGLLGNSGSGKTSLMMAVLRLLPGWALVSGRVMYEGQDLYSLTERRMREVRGKSIAAIFQEPHASLNPVVRVCDQVAETIRAHRAMGRREATAEAGSALRRAGLEDPSSHRAYPHELSGGQAQRVLIAQALAHRPRLLIADEPTGALDTITQAEVMNVFRKLAAEAGAAILLITHQPALLEGFATRRLRIEEGKLQAA